MVSERGESVVQRTMSMFAVAGLLVVGLAACGAEESGGGSTAARTTTADATSSTSEETTKTQSTKTRSTTTTTVTSTSASSAASSTTTSNTSSPTPRATSQTSQTSSPETTSTSDVQSRAATVITNAWVDDSWMVREEPSDVCGGSIELYGSIYSTQDSIFSCGSMAAGALACADEGGGETVCMTNVQQRTAMRFSSPTVASKDFESNGTAPQPLYVELDDGVECASLGRDHDQHWGGKYSWYRCSDDSELLTDEDIHNTFDSTGDTWTVQRSTNKGAPVETSVKTVAYAGK